MKTFPFITIHILIPACWLLCMCNSNTILYSTTTGNLFCLVFFPILPVHTCQRNVKSIETIRQITPKVLHRRCLALLHPGYNNNDGI